MQLAQSCGHADSVPRAVITLRKCKQLPWVLGIQMHFHRGMAEIPQTPFQIYIPQGCQEWLLNRCLL